MNNDRSEKLGSQEKQEPQRFEKQQMKEQRQCQIQQNQADQKFNDFDIYQVFGQYDFKRSSRKKYQEDDYQNQTFQDNDYISTYQFEYEHNYQYNLQQEAEYSQYAQSCTNLNKQQRINQKNNPNLLSSLNDKDQESIPSISQPVLSRSLNALVSASKPKRLPSIPTFQNTKPLSQSSSISCSSNLNQQNRKKLNPNGQDSSSQPLFINPFTSLPHETINTSMVQKFYKITYQEFVKKIQQLDQKAIVMGQKLFLKDKNNEKQLSQLFSLMGMKSPAKLGKGKAFRQFKAIAKYLKPQIPNPQNTGSIQKASKFGQGAARFDVTYLNQFKQLIGYKEKQDQFASGSQKNLLGLGFSSSK